jgi:hypothetical protein
MKYMIAPMQMMPRVKAQRYPRKDWEVPGWDRIGSFIKGL